MKQDDKPKNKYLVDPIGILLISPLLIEWKTFERPDFLLLQKGKQHVAMQAISSTLRCPASFFAGKLFPLKRSTNFQFLTSSMDKIQKNDRQDVFILFILSILSGFSFHAKQLRILKTGKTP